MPQHFPMTLSLSLGMVPAAAVQQIVSLTILRMASIYGFHKLLTQYIQCQFISGKNLK